MNELQELVKRIEALEATLKPNPAKDDKWLAHEPDKEPVQITIGQVVNSLIQILSALQGNIDAIHNHLQGSQGEWGVIKKGEQSHNATLGQAWLGLMATLGLNKDQRRIIHGRH